MKRFILFIIIALGLSVPSIAQKTPQGDDYKFRKAFDLLQEQHDEDGALKLLSELLEETPDDVKALTLRMQIYDSKREYGLALADVNHALKVNKPKSSGVTMSRLFHWQGYLYQLLGEDEKAIVSLKEACRLAEKDNRPGLQKVQFDYADALYHLHRYDEADEVYGQMLANDEGDVTAMVGIARNMIERGQYAEAAELCEKAKRYESEYSGSYKFSARAYDKLGETDKAIDNVVSWFSIDGYEVPFDDELFTLCARHKNYAVAKFREKIKSSEEKSPLEYALLRVYEASHDYEQAIRGYDDMENEYGRDKYICARRGLCYQEFGLFDSAISEFKALFEMTDDAHAQSFIGDCCRDCGRYEEAIDAYSAYIEEYPSTAYGYYARGWCYELKGDDSAAMEDYELGIDIDKTYPYIFLMRGEMYLKQGQKEKAEQDFQTVLQMDTVSTRGTCRHYALHFLDRDDEAQEWMEKIIKEDPEDNGRWYDQTCLFCRMGRLDEAVEALKKSFALGYSNLAHLEHDDDIDPIRDRDDFKQMVKERSVQLEERVQSFLKDTRQEGEPVITEVAINRHAGGTFEVPCTVNGLNLNMLFDTGASDVSISSVEANFMLKNDYLSEKDIKGKKYYQIADGGISEGTVITLKEVKVGDAVLRNVDASVVKNQKAPLLLGQSVMERFGTITIDNIGNKLIIKQ